MAKAPSRRLHALAAALAVLALPSAGAAQELVDGIAAQVGADIVLVSEVRSLSAPMEVRLREAGAPEEQIELLRSEVLESLIERALIRQVVRRAELEASDAEVDQAVEGIARENGLTLDQLRQSVEAQGLDFAAYRSRIRSEIEQRKVVDGMVASRVRVDDAEIRERWREQYSEQPEGGEEAHLRQILVPFENASPEAQTQACEVAGGALARVRAGEPFEVVASQVSAVSPERGGDLGWIHEVALASWMAPTVRALQPGQVSDVVKAPFGCCVLQVVERRAFRPLSYEEARDSLRNRIFAEKMELEYRKFVDKLREQTYVERKGVFSDPGVAGAGAAFPAGATDTF
jgi:peptidyl-prolyl cis-trans isomerase SurA